MIQETKIIKDLRSKIEKDQNFNRPERSAWGRGVQWLAWLLFDSAVDWNNEQRAKELDEASTYKEFEKILLNGAENWHAYSYGGCALIYDRDIAKTLCNKTELKLTRNGEKRPNKKEDWLDVQARALYQACMLLWGAISRNF